MTGLQDYLTVAQAARELGLTPQGVRKAVAVGTLQVVRLDGRTNLVPRSEIERYRREHQTGRGRPPKSRTQPATPAESE
jgi:excisionase family DNA binding protein